MIIDDRSRKFFSDRKVLEQADELYEALNTFSDDLAERIFRWIEQEISEIVKRNKNWELRISREETPRFIGTGWKGGTKWPKSLQVEFGWNRKNEFDMLPGDPWVGVRTSGVATQRKVDRAVAHLFSEKATKDADYAIFEYIEDWPNLNTGDWADLWPLIEGEGRAFLEPLIRQISQITKALE